MSCGRIRKDLNYGVTQYIDDELSNLKVSMLTLGTGERYVLSSGDYEYGLVLITGHCEVEVEGDISGTLGPRDNPYNEKPYGIMLTRDQKATFTAISPTLLGIGSAPAVKKFKNIIIKPNDCGGGLRGRDNWQRDVRFVIWSDNTEGNMLLIGETVIHSGNWGTIPPHRHQQDIQGEEVPYDEAFFYKFSKPQGFALAWQFDENKEMDQAFSIQNNDLLYMDKGYHPVVCGPGFSLYQLTLMAGPQRISKASVHKDFVFLLEETHMDNPYEKQSVK